MVLIDVDEEAAVDETILTEAAAVALRVRLSPLEKLLSRITERGPERGPEDPGRPR